MSKTPEKKRTKLELAQKSGTPLQEKALNNERLRKSEIVEIKEELELLNPHIFDGVDETKKGELLQTFSQMTLSVTERHHSGPLPPAETLIQYNSVIPNGADRIMIMAEKQQDHRMALENKAITSQLGQSRAGQIFGFILCLLALSASTYLGFTGHEAIGSIIGSTTIIAMASIFVLGKRSNSKSGNENEDKEKEE
jgi:uncharacterized membrane protein